MKGTEFLAGVKGPKSVNLEFTGSHVVTNSDGKTVRLILTLANPIAKVMGKGTIGGEPLVGYDVDKVIIHENDMDDPGLNFNEDGSGTINSERLMLDVSKNLDVWLTKEPLGNVVKTNREQKSQSIVEKLRSARLGTKANPEVSASGAGEPGNEPDNKASDESEE